MTRIKVPIVADVRAGGTRYYVDNQEVNLFDAGAPLDGAYVMIGNNGDLSDERALAASSPLNLDDGGANGTVTIEFSDQADGTVLAGPVSSGPSPPSFRQLNHSELGALGNDDHAIYLLTDGTRALSADWDAGGYTIRSLRFHSDQATGTAPFTIASTTIVTNLNADLLDGNHAAAFAAASHTHSHDTDLTDVSADDHHAALIGLEDASATAVTPAADDRIQLQTGNSILGIVAGTNVITFTVDQGNIDHGSIAGLAGDDHTQYYNAARHTLAVHTSLGLVASTRAMTAGNGLTGGGDLSANRTIAMGTPSTLDASTINTVSAISHAHAVTTTSVGAASTIVATNSSGQVSFSSADNTVTGTSTGAGSTGVYGINNNAGGYGVTGYSNGSSGVGVLASIGGSGGASSQALYCTNSGSGWAAYFHNKVEFNSDVYFPSGGLQSDLGGTTYTGYIFVPLTTPATSTSWDGDSFSDVGTSTVIDLSAAFGIPGGVKAVLMEVICQDSATWGTSGLYFACGPSSTYWYALSCRPAGGDVLASALTPVPTNSNGDIYYRINASGSNTMNVWIRIWGYWL